MLVMAGQCIHSRATFQQHYLVSVWMVLSAFILSTAVIAAQLLCVGHSFTPYLYIDLDISDLEVASPHNLEMLEDNNQTTD